jgi:hypothetical protein
MIVQNLSFLFRRLGETNLSSKCRFAILGLIQLTVLLVCISVSGSPIFAGVLIDASGNDATGDQFGPRDFDLLSMVVDADNNSIVFRLRFAEDISVDIADANYVSGYIDLDLDQNLATDYDAVRLPGQTSGGSNVEFFANGSGENFSTARLGTDLYIDLFAWSSPSVSTYQVEIIDVLNGNIYLGLADLQLVNSKEFSISISQSLFTQPLAASSFNFGAIVGAIPSTSDPFASDVAVAIQGVPPVVPEPSSVVVFAIAASLFVRFRTR